MSFRTMHFPGMTINSIESDGDQAIVEIGYAIIVKNMDDAQQDTRWHGKGLLKINELIVDDEDFPEFPATVTSADIKDNQITYRDEVVIPFRFHGSVGIKLSFENTDLNVQFIGESMQFDLSDHEKYIEHIQAE